MVAWRYEISLLMLKKVSLVRYTRIEISYLHAAMLIQKVKKKKKTGANTRRLQFMVKGEKTVRSSSPDHSRPAVSPNRVTGVVTSSPQKLHFLSASFTRRARQLEMEAKDARVL